MASLADFTGSRRSNSSAKTVFLASHEREDGRTRLKSRFSAIQTHLPEPSGSLWVHSRLQIGFFQEVAAARVTNFFALTTLELPDSCFRTAAPLDDSHNPAGFICPEVVPDNSERRLGFITCHKVSAVWKTALFTIISARQTR